MDALLALARPSFYTKDRDSDVSWAIIVWDLYTVTPWGLGVWVVMLGEGHKASSLLRAPTPLGSSYSP